MVIIDILLIALVGMIAGLVSIPFGFGINDNPFVVYLGNALGSLFALICLLYLSNKIINKYIAKKVSKKDVDKVGGFINKHGVRAFGLVAPLFPGVTIAVPSALILKLDMKFFKFWLYIGIFLVSAVYVFGYWWTVVK